MNVYVCISKYVLKKALRKNDPYTSFHNLFMTGLKESFLLLTNTSGGKKKLECVFHCILASLFL